MDKKSYESTVHSTVILILSYCDLQYFEGHLEVTLYEAA